MLSAKLRDGGVVGAGGAGFPAHVKACSEVEYFLANGAECEPLLHKDAELMRHFPSEIVDGMRLMMESTKARQGRFGIKTKNAEAVEAVRPHIKAGLEFTFLGDFYPSGDEYELVYAATGRLIPPAGIPLQVGCVVNNVETLYNVRRAADGQPVTEKFLCVSGAVRRPKSFWAPVGTPFRQLIEHAGGSVPAEFGVFVSGLMMGTLTFDLDQPVTKTTGGLIVLPADHYLVSRRTRTQAQMAQIGKSACDQCSYCTEFCPRYLLGYDVQPHKVMRSLGFILTGEDKWNLAADLCCACGLCTLYACPEDLYPKEACDGAKASLRQAGLRHTQTLPVTVHPMKEYRRVPLAMLRRRLKVEQYEAETPFDPASFEPSRVTIMLRQHAGRPAVPIVKKGSKVNKGQAVGHVPEGELGADVHASIAGKVTGVDQNCIVIEAR
jgi:Na+-translocating ferredoxin:NAD+ oxidoreductase RnfC subunit